MKFTSFEEMLTRNLHDYADKPAFRYEKDGSCVTVTHAEFFADVTNRKNIFWICLWEPSVFIARIRTNG